MKLATAKVLSAYIEGKMLPADFEEWVYTNQALEKELTSQVYLELISLNFKDRSIRQKIESLIEVITIVFV